MLELARRFRAVFDGNMRVHGIYDLSRSSNTEQGKTQGHALTKKTPPTLELWEAHLSGKMGLGIVPIRDDDTVSFGAVDIDSYDGLDHTKIAQKIEKNSLPLIVCRSKSGGAHIYCFSQVSVTAGVMHAKLREVAGFLGHGTSEIFPKQIKILADQGDVGSWINMPYFNGLRGMRYAVKPDGDAATPEEFLEWVERVRAPELFFSSLIVSQDAEFRDGPPCLQTMSVQGFPEGTRNNSLTAMGIYLKRKHPDVWPQMLDEFNRVYMDPPLKQDEVKSVAKSLSKKSYNYACNSQPLISACNAGLCRTRKYGVGKSDTALPEFGSLTKLNTDPPIWFWNIDGKRVSFETAQIQEQRLLQRRVMDIADMVIPTVSKAVWESCLREALTGLVVIEVQPDETPKGQFMLLLEKFCTGRAQAMSLEEIVLGRPWTDSDVKRHYFQLMDLLKFLLDKKFTDLGKNKIQEILRETGKHHSKIMGGRTVNYWSVPAFAHDLDVLKLPESVRGEEAPF